MDSFIGIPLIIDCELVAPAFPRPDLARWLALSGR
jgi:hypothetical protein